MQRESVPLQTEDMCTCMYLGTPYPKLPVPVAMAPEMFTGARADPAGWSPLWCLTVGLRVNTAGYTDVGI